MINDDILNGILKLLFTLCLFVLTQELLLACADVPLTGQSDAQSWFPAGHHLYCCSVVVHTKVGGGEQWSPLGQTPGTSCCYQSIKFVQKYFTTSLFL